MRIRIFIRTDSFQTILARKNKTPDWLADQLSTSTGYVYLLIKGYRTVSPIKRDRITELFRGQQWDRLFRIEEATTTAQ